MSDQVEFNFCQEEKGEAGNFEIELSDFSFVTRGIKNGKALRFTTTWKILHPKYGLLGESEEGWLCTRNGKGQLRVSPPISRFGPMQSKQLKVITVALHDLILRMLQDNKTKKGVSYVDYVGQNVMEDLRARAPEEIDPDFPALREIHS